jgi:ABC-type multidrug transport system ATPase subunit
MIGYVPALPVYYPFLTPRDVLEYRAARLAGPAVSRGAIDRAINDLGLTASEPSVIANLSLDEIRRLAIAEALVSGAQAVLVDSCASDTGTIYSCRALDAFRAIARSGVALVLACRDASSVIAVATRLTVLGERRAGFAAWETALYLARDERVPSLQYNDARGRELRAR